MLETDLCNLALARIGGAARGLEIGEHAEITEVLVGLLPACRRAGQALA